MKRLLTVLALAGFVAACGGDEEEPKGNGNPDGGVDASVPDGGPRSSDAGPRSVKVTNAGEPCTSAEQCAGTKATCDTKSAFSQPLAGGYCSASCLHDDECGSAACPLGEIIGVIGPVDGQTAGSCYNRCEPSSSGACRAGYVCSSLSKLRNIPENKRLPWLLTNVCLPLPVGDGGVPVPTDGGVDGGRLDAG